jgi:hypothetical protein
MGLAIDYKKEIINVSKELPEEKLKELVDFAQFLKTKKEKFSFPQVINSAEQAILVSKAIEDILNQKK